MSKQTKTPTTIVKMNLNEFLDWQYSDREDVSCKKMIEIQKKGLKPLKERITNSKELFNEVGYIPFDLVVKNKTELKKLHKQGNTDVDFDDINSPYPEITGGNFLIKWV